MWRCAHSLTLAAEYRQLAQDSTYATAEKLTHSRVLPLGHKTQFLLGGFSENIEKGRHFSGAQ
jgi:hypothetical protein